MLIPFAFMDTKTMDRDLGLDRREPSSRRADGGRRHQRDRERASSYGSDRREVRHTEHRHHSHQTHHHHSSRSERNERDREDEKEKDHRRLSTLRHEESREGRGRNEDEFVHPSRRGLVERTREDRSTISQHSNRNAERQHRERSSRRDRDRDRYERNGNRDDRPPRPSRRDIDVRSRGRSASPDGNLVPMRYEQINDNMNRTFGSSWGRKSGSPSLTGSPPPEKEVPNYEQSGALMGDKLYKGVSLQYAEPPEARKPEKSYRFYVFKDGDIADTLTLDQRPTYLFGRDRTVADVPLDHPSCSKQHAVLQYRLVVEEGGMFGEPVDRIAPFIYDLGSANGTQLNGEKVPVREYVELKEKDMVTFGLSSREYLLLTDEEAKEL
ncbi:SMAD/FHA domain-containing protein [Lipomyces chichibuensis]|uniref:SMAD/FHA domain-containing protein n=1 Tax=Lipomyces chichibuensis TaxID=1546026 RepID=UPI00334309A3